MTGNASVSNERLISPQSAKDAIFDALRQFISAPKWGKPHTPDEVAEALTAAGHKITGETVSRWIAGSIDERRTPTTDVLIMLFGLLGPAFTSKVLGEVGQGAHNLEPKPGEPGYVIARLAHGVSEFASRGADHVYCNKDRPILRPHADEMIQILQPFSSRRDG